LRLRLAMVLAAASTGATISANVLSKSRFSSVTFRVSYYKTFSSTSRSCLN
jgi:hypothetical protein